MPDISGKKGKINPSLVLNLIGAFASVLGIALISLTANPIVEIAGGVIVAGGIALVSLSKHLG